MSGGTWENGMVIYDAIRSCRSYVTMLVHGQAYSMGAVILQAADFRVIQPNASVMVHAGDLCIEDTHTGVKSAVRWEECLQKKMLDILAIKCAEGLYFCDEEMTHAQIVRYINEKLYESQDWYLTAEEAVHYGFVDAVLGSEDAPTLAALRR
jgi:ATP-dependent protease ClpP protease subunit